MFVRTALIAFCLLLFALPAPARSIQASVSHVTDGDTIWVRPLGAREAVPVRIDGIDAPEICQPFGKQARDALAAHILHRPVQVDFRSIDVYERNIASVSLQGEDIAAWLVDRGYAWSARFHGRAGPYAKLEARARENRRGLWASPAQEPRKFRKLHGSCH